MTNPESKATTLSSQLKTWRRAVLAASEGRCAGCWYYYRTRCTLQAHHLESDPALALDVDNGVALCAHCRRDFWLRFGRGNNTYLQFVEWQRLRWGREL